MLFDHWPLPGLVVRIGQLELRLPNDDELGELADLAALGIHQPGERPFLMPWPEGSAAALKVIQRGWRQRGSWTPDDWELGLAVFENGVPLGIQDVRASNFAIRREISSSSWVGLAHHGRGIGTQMRAAMLHLAFAGLEATDAVTASFVDNHAPLAVSRKLGYQPDGITRDVSDDKVKVSQRFRLTSADWELTRRPEVSISGLEACLPFFVAS